MNDLYMGAINIETNKRETPRFASKHNTYKCPECNKEVQLRQGNIRKWHFAHKRSDNPCNFYYSYNESQIHKEAKHIIKYFIDSRKEMVFWRECNQCDNSFKCLEVSKTNYNDNITAVLEYPFKHNDSNKKADIAMIEGKDLKIIFEICKTHKTEECNRPSEIPWVDINAVELIKHVNETNEFHSITINCIRDYKCVKCIKKNEEEQRKLLQRIDKETFYRIKREQDMKMEQSIADAEAKIRAKKWRMEAQKRQEERKIFEEQRRMETQKIIAKNTEQQGIRPSRGILDRINSSYFIADEIYKNYK